MLDEEDDFVVVAVGLLGGSGEAGVGRGAATDHTADDLALRQAKVCLADRDLLVDLAQLASLTFGHDEILLPMLR